MKFPLQVYDTYSTFSGVGQPEQWAEHAAKHGYKALGICNKNDMGGHIHFQDACFEHGIKPIFGVELYVVDDCSAKKNAKDLGVVLLYAKDSVGYANIISANNFSQRRVDDGGGYYYRPKIDLAALDRFSEGVICVSPGPIGAGTRLTPTGQMNDVNYLFTLLDSFGDDFYVGYNPFAEEGSADWRFVEPSHSEEFLKHFRLVPVSNSHVYSKDVEYLYDAVRLLDNSQGRQKFNADRDLSNFAMPEPEDWGDVDTSALQEIYDKCDYQIPTGKFFMPTPHVKEGLIEDLLEVIGQNWKRKFDPDADFDTLTDISQLSSSDDRFPHEHIVKGEAKEGLKTLKTYRERLIYEMEIIDKLGYFNYFHVVEDFCRFIDKKFPAGRGFARGSAAGSLFTYLLNITSGIDPVRHNLYFDRFLNVDRQDMPDIDIDFSSEARAEVIKYLRDKYGEERVPRIGAYRKMKIASGIKAFQRAYAGGFPDNDGNIVSYDERYITKILDSSVKQTARGRQELDERLEYEPFKNFYELHSDWVEKYLMPLQESVTGRGLHAGGVVILDEDVDGLLACTFQSKYGAVTMYDKVYVEKRGFPKFDLLVINGPDIISHTKRLVQEYRGEDVVDIEHLPLDDKRTLKIFHDAKTEGIFQYKTWVQTNYLSTLKPTSFDHLVAAVALGRPGPMGFGAHTEYADRKNGRKPVVYDHPDLEPILKETYGLMVFQEQMMRVCTDIAGMSGPQSDYVRKACGKKKMKEMVKWEQVFKDGCKERGYEEELADKLWSQIVGFAEYSFNKSHAAAYALQGYYQAYVRSRYRIEYWCAALKYAKTSLRDDNNVYNLRDEALLEGIRFVYPNIHGFAREFYPAGKDSIYWPLRAIKGIGKSVTDSLCPEQSGGFSTFEEMMESIDHRSVNKGVIKKFIKAGFFDPIGKPWEAIETYNDWRSENKMSTIDAFDMSHRDEIEWLKLKNDAYNMYVDSWKNVAPFHENINFIPASTFEKLDVGEKVFIGGLVEKITIKQTKNGGWFCKLLLTDLLESYRVMIWSDVWERDMPQRPKEGSLVELIGKKDEWSPPDSDAVFHSVHTIENSYFRVVHE